MSWSIFCVSKSNNYFCYYPILVHIAQMKQEEQLQMKVEAELNLCNSAILIDHYRFLHSRPSLILNIVQGDTVHCVQ